LTWEHGRQLASFTRGDTAVSYEYNDEGIRTSKTVNNTTTTYNVIDGSLRSMTDGTNTLRFFENSVLFNNVEYWYVYNAQNDVIGLINADGEYVVEYTYSAYGLPLSKTGTMADTLGTLNPFRYRGYIYDEETGLYYVSSRYYDPAIGRWLNSDSEDLINVSPEVPYWDKNLYAYCDNNPVMRLDACGKLWNTVIGAIGGAIAGGISAAIAGSDIGAGILCGAMSGAFTGLLIDAAVWTGGTGLLALALVSGLSGVGAGFTSCINQRLNGKDIDVGTAIVDGLWGAVGGALSFGLAGGGDSFQSLKQIFAQPAKKVVQQAAYDLTMATMVSTGTAACAIGTTSTQANNTPTYSTRTYQINYTCYYSKDWYRYRYAGRW